VRAQHDAAQPKGVPPARISRPPSCLQITNNPENDGCVNAVLLV